MDGVQKTYKTFQYFFIFQEADGIYLLNPLEESILSSEVNEDPGRYTFPPAPCNPQT
jgi:hypothetical protein